MTYHDPQFHAALGQDAAYGDMAPSLRDVPRPTEALPLYMVDDMASAKRRFAAMGFEIAPAFGKPGTVAMQAGASQILLIETSTAKETMPLDVVSSISDGPALYIWVDSIMDTRARLADPVIGEMVTGYGTWELFVESRIGLIIFAERLQKQNKTDA